MVIQQPVAASASLVVEDNRTNSGYQFLGETWLTFMEFHLDSAEYCQAQHK